MEKNILIVITLLLASRSSFAYESPSYDVLSKPSDDVEIRKYPATKWVSVKSVDLCGNLDDLTSSMFMKLFNYISGQNDQNAKIEMTVPVLVDVKNLTNKCEFTMSFYIPKVNQANTPKPLSEAFIQTRNAQTVATIRFSWYTNMKTNIQKRDALLSLLGADAKQYNTIDMTTAGYDSPWKFWDRRNEIWILKNEIQL